MLLLSRRNGETHRRRVIFVERPAVISEIVLPVPLVQQRPVHTALANHAQRTGLLQIGLGHAAAKHPLAFQVCIAKVLGPQHELTLYASGWSGTAPLAQ